MKLYISDNGDPSVGIFGTQWEIECPFEKSECEEKDLVVFKNDVEALYAPYCEGRMWSAYDFELQEHDEVYTEFVDQPTEYDK